MVSHRDVESKNLESILTCHTPIIAFKIKITRITNGSTNAVVLSSPSSNKAKVWKTKKQNEREL